MIKLMLLSFWHRCKFLFLGSVITMDWVHVVGHSPVFQILLQIATRASIYYIVILIGLILLVCYPLQPDIFIFDALTAAITSSHRIEWCSSSVIRGQSSTFGSPPASEQYCGHVLLLETLLLLVLYGCRFVLLLSFSVVRSLTSWYAFLLLFFLMHFFTSCYWPPIHVSFAIFIYALIFLLMSL